jgi:hypothetical protein
MAFGIVVVAMLYQLAHWLELRIVQAILRYALNYSPIAIIVLFQSEIRAALTHIGKTLRNPMSLRERSAPRHGDFDEVVLAAGAGVGAGFAGAAGLLATGAAGAGFRAGLATGFALAFAAAAVTTFLAGLLAGLVDLLGFAAFLTGLAGIFLATDLIGFFTVLAAAFLAAGFLIGLDTGLALAFTGLALPLAGLAAGFALATFRAGAGAFLADGLAAFFAGFLVATRLILSFLESQRRRVIA